MKRNILGPLWIAIVSLGLMVLGKIAPAILTDAFLSGVLLGSIILGHKWAYVLTFIFTILGMVTGLAKGVESGVAILILDFLVLVPVLVCTGYFFPKSQTRHNNAREATSCGRASEEDGVRPLLVICA